MSRNNKSTKTDSAMNNKGRKLIAQIKDTDKNALVKQSKPRKSAKKGKIVLHPSLVEMGSLPPLPGYKEPQVSQNERLGTMDWFTCKSEILNRCIELTQFGMKIEKMDLSYRQKKLLNGAVKSALESLEDYKETVADSGLTDQERLGAYNKAMLITEERLMQEIETIEREALEAVDNYLQAEAQEERYTEVMWALDELLSPRGSTTPETEDFATLTTELTRFLFNPEVGAKFYASTKFSPDDVVKHMERLTKFFKDLQKDEAEADMERFCLKVASHRYDYSDLGWIKWQYNKLAAISRAKTQVDQNFKG